MRQRRVFRLPGHGVQALRNVQARPHQRGKLAAHDHHVVEFDALPPEQGRAIAELRTEMRTGFAELRTGFAELRTELAEQDTRMRAGFATMAAGMADITTLLHRAIDD